MLSSINLKIGVSYVLFDNWKIECLFIKTSPKGYNFLNLKTNECVLKKAISPYKHNQIDIKGYNTFLLPRSMKIWELNKEINI